MEDKLTPEEIARNGAINAEKIAQQAGEQAKDYGKRVWYPTVDADGNLTWQKSKSDARPRKVNIRGPRGFDAIIGDVSNIKVISDLSGGSDSDEKIEVLDASVGKLIDGLMKGTSPSTDAKMYPHKWINEINVDAEGGELLNNTLNNMNSRDGVGFYRGSFGGSLFSVETIGVSYNEGNYVQCVRGSLSIKTGGGSLIYGSRYKILVRECNNSVWGAWYEYKSTTSGDIIIQ